MKNEIRFDMADWEEIVEALGSKIHMIQSGQLGPEDRPGQDKEWIAHLRRIIRKIEGRKCKGVDFAVFKKPVITKQGGQSK
ncbi:MAG: hypothetical protein KCHDKBKB_02229 [Elusimicrobia bacterium]|nr:hypothetical protein [Elusimicrobiota bacterium]